MITISSGAKTKFKQNPISVSMSFVDNGTTVTIGSANILSFGYNAYCTTGDVLELGNVTAAQIIAEIFDDVGTYDAHALIGKELTITASNEQTGTDDATIYLGYFFIDTAKRTESKISITALDRMVLLDKKYPTTGVTRTGKPGDLIAAIAQYCGCPHETTYTGVNNTANVTLPENYTCRELVSMLACLLGKSAYIDRTSGKLELSWFATSGTALESYDDSTITSLEKEDEEITVSGVNVIVGDNEYFSGSVGYVLNVNNNPLITDATAASVAANLATVCAVTYLPLELNGFPTPYMELFDKVSVNGSTSYITSVDWNLNAGYAIAAKGKSQQLASYEPIYPFSEEQKNIIAVDAAKTRSAIAEATAAINGANGGYVVIDAVNGQPQSISIMSTPTVTPITKIWKWSMGGLAYSADGGQTYTGPAILNNGTISADFLKTGKILSQDGSSTFELDMLTGLVKMKDAIITGGSINIVTASETSDRIQLSYNQWTAKMAPVEVRMQNSSTGNESALQAGGVFFDNSNGNSSTMQSGVVTLQGDSGKSSLNIGSLAIYDATKTIPVVNAYRGNNGGVIRAIMNSGTTGVSAETDSDGGVINVVNKNGIIAVRSSVLADGSGIFRVTDGSSATTSATSRIEAEYNRMRSVKSNGAEQWSITNDNVGGIFDVKTSSGSSAVRAECNSSGGYVTVIGSHGNAVRISQDIDGGLFYLYNNDGFATIQSAVKGSAKDAYIRVTDGSSSTTTATKRLQIENNLIQCADSTTSDLWHIGNGTARPFSNPNLLMNPWFTINQRKTSGNVPVGGYTGDRWYNAWSARTSFSSHTVTMPETGIIQQDLAYWDNTKGYTFSIKYTNGTISYVYVGTTRNTYVAVDSNFSVHLTSTGRIYIRGIGAFTAVKLEVGALSTLANDVEPNYNTELLKCMNYYMALGDIRMVIPIVRGRTVYLSFPIPCPMSSDTPSFSYTNFYVFPNAGSGSPLSHSQDSITINGCSATVSTTVDGTTGLTGAVIDLSGLVLSV